MPEEKIVDHPSEEHWLVLYFNVSTGQWVMVDGRQFASERLARETHAEYCRVMGAERSRLLFTGDSHRHVRVRPEDSRS